MEEYKTILKKTDGGLDIFSYYLGKECLKKKFKSPFRSGDNRPSCHLYLNEPPGEQAYYYLQDFVLTWGSPQSCALSICAIISPKR